MKRNKALAEQVARLVEAGNDSHIAARSLGMTDADLDGWLESWMWFQVLLREADAKAEVDIVEELGAESLFRMRKARARYDTFQRLRELTT